MEFEILPVGADLQSYLDRAASACWDDIERYLITPKIRRTIGAALKPPAALVGYMGRTIYFHNGEMYIDHEQIRDSMDDKTADVDGIAAPSQSHLRADLYHEQTHHLQMLLEWPDPQLSERSCILATEGTAEFASVLCLLERVDRAYAELIFNQNISDAARCGFNKKHLRVPFDFKFSPSGRKTFGRKQTVGFARVCQIYPYIEFEEMLLNPRFDDESTAEYLARAQRNFTA